MLLALALPLGIPILAVGTACRLSRRKHKKKKARERMKRIQIINQHIRLHDLERKYASVAGGAPQRQAPGSNPTLSAPQKKKPKSTITIKRNKPKKRNMMESAKQRTKRTEALRKCSSLRERIQRSRQRDMDLWDCAVTVSM